MKKIKGLISLLVISLALFSGCSAEKSVEDKIQGTVETSAQDYSGYEQISQDEAKDIMDTETDYILIDARTIEEFDEGHIEGAILIPEYEIAQRAEKELPDKDSLILVYCRSGRRSKIASQILSDMGYTNVKEFGGIIDWQYEIVK